MKKCDFYFFIVKYLIFSKLLPKKLLKKTKKGLKFTKNRCRMIMVYYFFFKIFREVNQMKKFLSPEAELLELDLADVICSSFETPLDPNAGQADAPAPTPGTTPDGENEF